MNKIESRRVAHTCASSCKRNLEINMAGFEKLVFDTDLSFFLEHEQEALTQLRDRGELEHLISWVWTFRRD